MKNFKTLSLLAIINLLFIGTNSWADINQLDPYATCSTHSSQLGYHFDLPFPNQINRQYVIGSSRHKPGIKNLIDAEVKQVGWNVVSVKFEFEDRFFAFDFVNFTSPTLVTGEIDDEKVAFACQLNW